MEQKIDLEALEAALARYNEGAIFHYSLFEAAYAALPALIAELRELRALTTPEPIREKHRDGNWWMVWAPGAESWFKCRWRSEFGDWQKGGTTEHLMSSATHALPMPPEVKP